MKMHSPSFIRDLSYAIQRLAMRRDVNCSEQIVVDMPEAGMLSSKIGNRRALMMVNLKVNGIINSSDLSFIRMMARRNLQRLDLSDACIVDGRYGFGTNSNVVAPHSFSLCTRLREIVLPKGVVSIGHNAFSHCKRLSGIVIPDSVTLIDSKAFYDCRSLREIVIPDSVATVGSFAFYRCKRLESVRLSASLNQISSSMFAQCERLSSVSVPDGVSMIGIDAFNGCHDLRRVTLPAGLERVYGGAFKDCQNLKEIRVGSERVPMMEPRTFDGCGKKCVVYVPQGSYHDYWLSEFGYFDKIVEF